MDYAFNQKIKKHYIITDEPSGAVNGRPSFRKDESRNFQDMREDEISWCFFARLEDPLIEIVFPKNWRLFRLQERDDAAISNPLGATKAREILDMFWGKTSGKESRGVGENEE